MKHIIQNNVNKYYVINMKNYILKIKMNDKELNKFCFMNSN